MALNVRHVDMWDQWSDRLDEESFKKSFLHHLKYTQGEDQHSATPLDTYQCAALAIRDRLIERMIRTQQAYLRNDVRRVYYMSMEFLPGRFLANNIINLKYFKVAHKALGDLGIDWDDIQIHEDDAGLGNGGLGRLAACFLDSLATLEYPAYGYGMRYEYGIFRQSVDDGHQVEHPDEWLRWGNPWEIPRPESTQVVEFGGHVEHWTDDRGEYCTRLADTEKVIAQPYDTPILGYGCNTVNLLRLWSARSSREFAFDIFNTGDYVSAVLDKTLTETLTRVLYPNDATPQGRELRFRQQYFFVSATLKDLIRRYKKNHATFDAFAEKTAIQLNDTHPSLSVSELMRLLVDREGIPWDRAWDMTTAILGYTNHTLLPEALEKWTVELFEKTVPRNLEIVYEINRRFLNEVRVRFPNDTERIARMSIVQEGDQKMIRMAHLAMVGSHSINGVARLHTELLKERVVPDFAEMWPEKFNNKTNGVTQRRWLLQANPLLAMLINERIGYDWITDLDKLEGLLPLLKDEEFCRQYREIKAANKMRLAKVIRHETGIVVDVNSIFDIQIKRMHEYKRQHLNALHMLYLYNRLKSDPSFDMVPRTFIVAGKAAPGYFLAKKIIRLITAIGDRINDDPQTSDRIKVVFLPNYRVSLAQDMIPAADVSEQISLAGKEASGTGNMKLAMNGAITVGTMDGANVEIHEKVGDENMVIFGMRAHEVAATKPYYDPKSYYEKDARLRQAIDQMASGFLASEEPGVLQDLVDNLIYQDPFMVLADFDAYVKAQETIDTWYRDYDGWTRRAIENTARLGIFSSDRTIREYANEIWKIEPHSILLPHEENGSMWRKRAEEKEARRPRKVASTRSDAILEAKAAQEKPAVEKDGSSRRNGSTQKSASAKTSTRKPVKKTKKR